MSAKKRTECRVDQDECCTGGLCPGVWVVGDAGFVLWVTLSNRVGLGFTAASRAWLGNVVIVGVVGHMCQPGVSADR